MEYRKDAWKKPKLLSSWEVEGVRSNPHHVVQYGDVPSVTTAKRRSICRACGQSIIKGEQRLSFFWDFTGCGSWTAQEVHIHTHDCTHVLDEEKPCLNSANDISLIAKLEQVCGITSNPPEK